MMTTKKTVEYLGLLSRLGEEIARISYKEINKRQSSQSKEKYQVLSHEDGFELLLKKSEKNLHEAQDLVSELHVESEADKHPIKNG